MSQDAADKTHQDFESSPWQDQSWELLNGEQTCSEDFIPMQITVVSEQSVIDPMFADYGGRSQIQGEHRWHLPEHLSVAAAMAEVGQGEDTPLVHELTDAEIESIKKDAFEDGRQASIEQSAQESQEKMAALELGFRNLFEDLKSQVEQERKLLEHKCVELALQISKKIIETTVDINPEYIIKVVNVAIDSSGAAEIKKIRVSPEDMEFIKYAGITRTIKDFDGSWEFIEDSTVRSGCILETSAGESDYQLDKAWERIRDNVVKVIR